MLQKKKKKKEPKVSPAQRRQERIDAIRRKVMVDVKRLAKTYGWITVQYCLNQITELEKKRGQLAQIKREVDQLEREIG